MKMILIAMLVIDDDCEEQTSPVPEPDMNPLDMLLARLLHETKKGRKADTWSIDPHGKIFKV